MMGKRSHHHPPTTIDPKQAHKIANANPLPARTTIFCLPWGSSHSSTVKKIRDLFAQHCLHILREIDRPAYEDYYKNRWGDEVTENDEDVFFLYVAAQLDKLKSLDKEYEEMIEKWRTTKDVLVPNPQMGDLEDMAAWVQKLEAAPKISRRLEDAVNKQLVAMNDRKDAYFNSDPKTAIKKHMTNYTEYLLKSIQCQSELDQIAHKEKCDQILNSEITSLEEIYKSSLMNIYVIQQPPFNMVDILGNSSVRKMCRSISEWEEDGDPNVWVPPFILLHCVFVSDKISAPQNALSLFNQTESRGGSYLVMRVHHQGKMFEDDEQDAFIPSGIGGLATVLKVHWHTSVKSDRVHREFVDPMGCLEPPREGTDLKRNLHYLVEKNNLQSAIKLRQILSRSLPEPI